MKTYVGVLKQNNGRYDLIPMVVSVEAGSWKVAFARIIAKVKKDKRLTRDSKMHMVSITLTRK